MIDLGTLSGLPMTLLDSGQLQFPSGVIIEEYLERPLRALARVVLDREAVAAAPESDIAYTMYNGVSLAADAPRLAGRNLRYELTSIPARRIGREYIKTLGHRHNTAPGSSYAYPEICEVLHGVAHFLFQVRGPTPAEAPSAWYVEVVAGEKIIIPPSLLHLTINPGPQTLLFSDVISLGMRGIYDDFRAAGGACYLEVEEHGQPRFIPNPRYPAVPELQRVPPPKCPALGIRHDVPLYSAFLEYGPQWRFLDDPDLFWPLFPEIKAMLSGLS